MVEISLANGNPLLSALDRLFHACYNSFTETVAPASLIGESDEAEAERFLIKWEVYKPEHQCRFGYYTLPILWGERLVARFDSKLDRKTNTFVVLGLWLEDEARGLDEAFVQALAAGLAVS